MKTIALIHTVKPVLDSFEEEIRAAVPEGSLKIYNILDDFLAHDPSPDGSGYFTPENKERMFNQIKNAQLTGADLIVTTCSTLSPIVLIIKHFVNTPILTIDEVMSEEVVTKAKKIKILATAKSTIEPSCQALYSAAEKLGKEISIDFEENEEAYKAMKNYNMELHDKLVLEQSTKSSNYDAIILAQASMAHLEEDIEAHTGTKTYSSPKRCIRRIIEIIGKD